ncbi:MAG: acetyl-CoA synthetase [Eubacteriales bacterium]|nr:acetyl-CoA synthetase [Eubacteriales bacterium]MDN5363814.1 acetyl-CoA synthetase [Eubacteriales bacterium]
MSEVQLEKLLIDPPAEFAAQANAKADLYEKAAADRLAFWADEAENLDWFKKWDKVLDDSNPPFFKWFVGGKINACYNCVDRHVKTWRRNKAAIIFEGEPGDSQVLTYDQLYGEVQKFANVLKSLGVQKGDRVTIYMPMIPEAVIAMLACARIGAPHSVVFGGFSSDALRDRINDAKAKLVITADGGWRRGKVVPLKANTDKALEEAPTVEKVIVVKRVGDAAQINWVEGRDLWYHELMAKADRHCEPEQCDAEDMLFILYTSGTTGKPKGILHTTGGYLTQANMTMRYVFDIKDTDVYWCTADIGWITGHSYVVYGPLSAGATVVLYEGGPDYPDKDRFWAIIEKYRVNIFYTAPTAIRTFMKWGLEYVQRHDLSSLRLLGTVGEPINPEAWMWYYKHIGGERCPIMDTWWQTETGAHMVSPLPGITPLRPGTATLPLPGIEVDVVDENGEPAKEGYLVVKSPWPSMMRTIFGGDECYVNQYWSRFNGKYYFTGDGAKRDDLNYIWVTGRVDDVLNVSGHRIGTAEVESALVECQEVAEAAVIGKKHEVKGEAIVAFVILKEGVQPSDELVNKLKKHVAAKLGAFCRPDDIIFTAELPKTRSGKIMRRLLRDIAEGRAIGDTTTLADPGVMAELKEKYASKEE